MIINNIAKHISMALCLLALGLTACTDSFDETNENPNKIYEANPNYVFPGIAYKAVDNFTRLNYRGGLQAYAQYTVTWLEQNETTDNAWVFEGFYVKSLNDLQKAIDDCGDDEKYKNSVNILNIWKAWEYYVMVSSFGGVPMTEANGKGVYDYYKYDSELEIYTAILDMLDKAVEELDPSGDQLLHDPVYATSGGKSDIARWRKFANSLRLNVAVAIQNLDATLAETHIRKALTGDNAQYLFSSVADNANFTCGDDINKDASYYWKDFLSQQEAGTNVNWAVRPAMSHNFYLYIKSYNDPRLDKYVQKAEKTSLDQDRATLRDDTITRVNPYNENFRDTVFAQYKIPYVPRRDYRSVPSGYVVAIDPNSVNGEYYRDPYGSITTGNNECWVHRDFLKSNATIDLLTWAEVCFAKAEVAIKYPGLLSETAQSYYEQGILASMTQYGVTAAAANAYMAQDGIKWDTDGEGLWEYRHFFKADIKGRGGDEAHLRQIWTQWYLADFMNGHGGWVLDRRTRCMPFPPHFYNGTTPSGSNGICDWMSERLIYPINEQSYNPQGYAEAIAQLAATSPAYSTAHNGDNFFTLLGIAAPQSKRDTKSLEQWAAGGEITYDGLWVRNPYGKTLEEVLAANNCADEKELKKAIAYVATYKSTFEPSTGYLISTDNKGKPKTDSDGNIIRRDPDTGWTVDPATGLLVAPNGYLYDKATEKYYDETTGWEYNPETGMLINPETGEEVDPESLKEDEDDNEQ